MGGYWIPSDLAPLRRVIVHEPGAEIENVTPDTAAEALFDDVLFLEPARAEHRQMVAVLARCAEVLPLRRLLADVLADAAVARPLLTALCERAGHPDLAPALAERPPADLVDAILGGVPERRDTFAQFVAPSHFALPPQPNAFFTRDPAFCLGHRAFVGAFARDVRATERDVLRAVLRHHPALGEPVVDLGARGGAAASIEGGDVCAVRDDLVVVGYSERTSVAGIDALLATLAEDGAARDVVIVELPGGRATFHLDKIFTLVDDDLCVAYPRLVTGDHGCRATVATLAGGAVVGFAPAAGLLPALAQRGVALDVAPCGGDDPVRQDREQWACGTNFLAVAPGKVVGYGRNTATFEALAARGFRVVSADDVVAGRIDLAAPGRIAVALDGGECLRGGGGVRCMTLPVERAGRPA